MLRKRFRSYFLAVTVLFVVWTSAVIAGDIGDEVRVRRIWDSAPHNAFTDLIRFEDAWYCVFREGKTHVSPDGALRVLRSSDGETWKSAALITAEHADLRDAKITVTPQGELMLCGAGALHDKTLHTHQSYAWFSKDGEKWSKAVPIGDPDFWLWRVTWHDGVAYGIGYSVREDRSIRLYRSGDGRKFDVLVERLFDDGWPNETSIVFKGDTAYCLLRRDNYQSPDANANGLIGVSRAPFTQWQWKDLGVKLGGPHMIAVEDGRLLAAVRLYDGNVRTALCWIDPEKGSLKEFQKLPSGGDTSYAGLVLHAGNLWVSYYSSHEGKTSIYLAKIDDPGFVADLGNRRELFIDDFLIASADNVSLKMHEPRLAPAMEFPADPLEYGTVIYDGEKYQLYTRQGRGAKFDGDTTEVTRYCESRDGIVWEKPSLGLHEIDGTKDNNVILHEAPFCHNFSPFLDRNPEVQAGLRYKALAGTVKSGLYAFTSPDGIHWKKMRDVPVINYTKEYAFDSQNVSFWSESEQQYVCYFRHFLDKQLRSVCRTTSKDFVNWTEPTPLRPNFTGEHLYTTQTHPYFRAPHIYIALPTRFHPDRGNSTDIMLMSARGGGPFERTFREAFIRPGLDPERWGNRSNYVALNVVPTSETEMSIYATPFRRFVLRTDGFASVHAGADTGVMITKPLRFVGDELHLNFATSAGGSLRVELQTYDGDPIPGYTVDEAVPLVGDSISQVARWKKGTAIADLENQPVRVRFVMQEADLYSIQFSSALVTENRDGT